MSDSAIAISHINNAGGSKSITYHEIAKKNLGKGKNARNLDLNRTYTWAEEY